MLGLLIASDTSDTEITSVIAPPKGVAVHPSGENASGNPIGFALSSRYQYGSEFAHYVPLGQSTV